MAQIPYRANLSAARYPFSLSRAQGSVIIPQADQNYDRRVDPQGETSSPGIPQAIYMENVLPTPEGYQSVGIFEFPALPWSGDFQVLEIKSAEESTLEVLVFKMGSTEVYRWLPNGAGWQSVLVIRNPATVPVFGPPISYAVINGSVYIFDGDSLYTLNITGPFPYSAALQQIESIYLNGLGTFGSLSPNGVLVNTKAIVSSYGYLILYKDVGTSLQVAWSSTLSPVDFVPSLVTGAGGGNLADAQGRAVMARNSAQGFYCYTQNNVILGTYTGNSRYPFRFQVVRDAPGIFTGPNIYSDIDEGRQWYVNQFHQIMTLNGDQGEQIAPEVSEFLERSYQYDSFDTLTNTFQALSRNLPAFRESKVYLFAQKYLCLSVAEAGDVTVDPTFDCVYVFDLQLRRYGKLKVQHTHLATLFQSPNLYRLAFINSVNGQVKYMEFRSDFIGHSAVLLLGKFRYVRSRALILEEMVLNCGPQCSVKLLPSPEGTQFGPAITPYFLASASGAYSSKYLSHAESPYINVLLKGSFDVSQLDLKFHVGANV